MPKADVVFVCVVLIQEQLMELDCVLPLKALMKTSSPESAVTLLSALSAHPPNNVRFPTQQDHSDGVGNCQ